MKKFNLIGLPIIIIALAISLAGCGKKGAEETSEPQKNLASEAELQELGDLFQKNKGLNHYYFEEEMVIVGQQIVTKNWIKGDKLRREMNVMGVSQITLGDRSEAIYMYTPDLGTAIKMNIPASQLEDYDPKQRMEKLTEHADIKKLNQETIDDKKCQVYSFENKNTGAGGFIKFWAWEDYGLPVKFEIKIGDQNTTINYRNYNFNAIDDSMFELPAGVTITDAASALEDLEKLESLKNTNTSTPIPPTTQ